MAQKAGRLTGGALWREELFEARRVRQQRCHLCGIQVPTVHADTNGYSYCGACWTREREAEVARTQAPDMMAIETYDVLCKLARAFFDDKATKRTLEFWEDASRVGFQALGSGAKRCIYYVSKGANDGPPTLTEWMNGLYEALGQPEKMTKVVEPLARKSVWEWLRKPGV